MHAVIHAADIQDRDGGVLVMASLLGSIPSFSSCTPMAAIRGRYFRPRYTASQSRSILRS